jgi:hypothetical protein
MGREEGRVTHFESLRYRLQVFVSTILKQLNKPPFLPQLCSISSKLVITHTMTPRPTVIGFKVIGVGLPAFLLSKNFYSESIGMSRLGTCLAGLTRSRCANSPSSSAYLSFR